MVFQHILDALDSLVLRCKDSERLLALCERHAHACGLRRLLRDEAQRCAQAVDQLREAAQAYGGDGHPGAQVFFGGSVAGALRRARLQAWAALWGYDDHMLLLEWARTQRWLLACYRQVLDSGALPDTVQGLVERQRMAFEAECQRL